MIKILFTDFASVKPDNADLIVNPDYADITCPKPNNADHHYGPINEKYTPLPFNPTKKTHPVTDASPKGIVPLNFLIIHKPGGRPEQVDPGRPHQDSDNTRQKHANTSTESTQHQHATTCRRSMHAGSRKCRKRPITLQLS